MGPHIHCDTLQGLVVEVSPDSSHAPFVCFQIIHIGAYDICFSSSVRRELRSRGSCQLNFVYAGVLEGGVKGIHLDEANRIDG